MAGGVFRQQRCRLHRYFRWPVGGVASARLLRCHRTRRPEHSHCRRLGRDTKESHLFPTETKTASFAEKATPTSRWFANSLLYDVRRAKALSKRPPRRVGN